MTPEDKYALKELLRGAGVFAGACGVFIIILIVLSHFASVPPPKPSSKVVDTYKGCDIIQWSDNHLATYKYFLYCPK
jgi:hypothetical protein